MKILLAPGFINSFERCFRRWWFLPELWYRFKCWAWKRHSTVRSRYLPHTWCDCTELLPETMFEILSRFIENECSPGHIDWEGSDHRVEVDGVSKNVRQEMQDLYDWWHQTYKKDYPAKRAEIYAKIEEINERSFISMFKMDESGEYSLFDPQYKSEEDKQQVNALYRQLLETENKEEKELNKMLIRLVALRGYMWT